MKLFTNSIGSEYIEFQAPRHKSTMTQQVATRDIDGVFGTFYDVVANPDPVLRKTGNYIDVLDEIKREPHVSSCAISRESGVLMREWRIDKQNASTKSVDVIEALLNRIDLRQIMRELLEAWGYGYQVSEVVWEKDGGLLLPKKVVGNPKRWYMFGRNNELRRKANVGDIKGEEVEPYKFLLTRYRASYDNPYGEAQYSLCFWPTTLKKGGIKFWAKWLERFGMPHAIGKTSRNAETKERNELYIALRTMVQDAIAVIPDDASIELLEANVSGSADAYERYAKYHDGQISTVILGHSAAVDSTPGRLGGEDMAMTVRKDIIENDCSMVQDTINKLIKWIHLVNPSLGTEVPTFELYEETAVDNDRATRDKNLSDTGQVKFTKEYFTRKYDFKDDEIEIVTAVPPPAPPSPLPEFSSAAKVDPVALDGQAEVDALVDTIADPDKTQPLVEALLKPILNLIENSSNFQEVLDGVAKLYPDMDESDIAGILEKAIFAGLVVGRLEE